MDWAIKWGIKFPKNFKKVYAKTELEGIQRRDRRLRKAWNDYGSVESVKKEKKKIEEKIDTSNLYSEDKDEEEANKVEKQKEILRTKPNIIERKIEEENEDDIPEEEKLEE